MYSKKWYKKNQQKRIKQIRQYKQTPAGENATRIAYLNQKIKWGYKIQARQKVFIALRSGKLKKERCRCGEIKVQAHHPNYSKPLEVIWVCDHHHKLLHQKKSN